MKYKAWFGCISGCNERYPLNEVIYRCKSCGGLLEVVHDMDQLKVRSGAAWMRLFDDRYQRTDYPFGSSVWGKKELVCPAVSDENVVSMYEGGSNLFWAERLGQELGVNDLWIKQCGNNPTGSFKDLGMTVLVSMVKQMISDGQDIRGIACASTGDTSASLAAYCAYTGIPSVVFLPKDKVSVAQLIQPIANGALTISLDTDFDGCMEIVQEVAKEEHIYLANSMNSLRIEGQKTISMEIVQQFDWEAPDVVVIPGGNLGNVSALGKGFLMMEELGIINKRPRIVCAQAERANPLYKSYLTGFEEFESIQAQQTIASAIQIGNPVSINRAIRVLKAFDGIVEQATEDEIANAAARADLTGLYNCPHTGVALAALFKLIQRGDISRDDRVIVISTANGLKFTDFKVKYHEERLEDVSFKHAQKPVELPPDYDAVAKVLDQRL
ncbi:MAG: threonine synthase [Candidatus Latescibacteria bacterium]|jgi:threonine synthase|nr:threonine synthase [Candidatus Latescibacterota bacterium]